MTELKPCPFCGKEVFISDMTYTSTAVCFYHEFGVKCPVLGGSIHIKAKTIPEAIEKWNRRAE